MAKSGTSMHQGMKNRSPAAPSAKPQGGSVNTDTTRSATAKSHSLGPRSA